MVSKYPAYIFKLADIFVDGQRRISSFAFVKNVYLHCRIKGLSTVLASTRNLEDKVVQKILKGIEFSETLNQ